MNRLDLLRDTAGDLAEIARAAPDTFRAATRGEVLALRYGGEPVSAAKRDELLAKCRAGEYVELEVEILAFEQETGKTNRNFVRFRDGAMIAIGRTGSGTPFLRDHDQYDLLSKGGVIFDSWTDKRDEGSYAIKQKAKLTAVWLVEMALRGLLDTVSIGFNPTGPVLCSACNAPIFTKCYHYRGDRLAEVDAEGGGKRLVRKSDGDIVVEFIVTAAELVETSAVNVPAVPGAHVEGIRAAMAAGNSDPESRKADMKLLAFLTSILSLAPTASEEEVTEAVKALSKERDTLKKELAIAESESVKLSTEIEKYKATERKTEEDAFIRDALSSGRISLADEEPWRDLFALDSNKAKENLAKRKPGSATPVGQERQSEKKPAEETKVETKTSTKVRETLTAGGVNADAAMKFARAFGATNPEKTMAGALGINGEEA